MSKLEQSMGEMYGVTIEVDCRLCPCIEVATGRPCQSFILLLEAFT
jgi:hypothetical protein